MSNTPPRKGRTSTTILIILLLTAAIVSVGTFYLVKNVVGNKFDFHLGTNQSTAQADAASPAPTETPAPEAPPEPKHFVISMVGDCALASNRNQNHFDSIISENGLEWPFSGTIDILGADDFTLANLECSFSDSKLTSSTTFSFLGKAEYAQILSLGSVEAVTNGNNHTEDYDAQGEADTHAAVDAAGVGYIGAGESQIFTTESGLKIGVYCPGWRNCTIQGAQEAIPALREAGADVVIYAPHWGQEGKYHANNDQQLVAHAAIDAGADIVCGTHPHVLQPMEEYNGGVIFYSLGNWSFGGNTSPRDRDTAIAQVTITQEPDGTCHITGFTLIPCSLSSTDGINDYRPTPYGEADEGFARAISKLDGSYTGPDLNVDYSFMNG